MKEVRGMKVSSFSKFADRGRKIPHSKSAPHPTPLPSHTHSLTHIYQRRKLPENRRRAEPSFMLRKLTGTALALATASTALFSKRSMTSAAGTVSRADWFGSVRSSILKSAFPLSLNRTRSTTSRPSSWTEASWRCQSSVAKS